LPIADSSLDCICLGFGLSVVVLVGLDLTTGLLDELFPNIKNNGINTQHINTTPKIGSKIYMGAMLLFMVLDSSWLAEAGFPHAPQNWASEGIGLLQPVQDFCI